MTAKHLLSIDPGEKSAWALWELTPRGWVLTSYGRLPLPRKRGGEPLPVAYEAPVIRELLGLLLPDWSGAQAVVEDQWYVCPLCSKRRGKAPRGRDWDSVSQVVANRSYWCAVLVLLGATVEVIEPRTWIDAMASGAPGTTAAERVAWTCRRRWPELTVTEDEAAAIRLGEWWLREHGQQLGQSSPRRYLGEDLRAPGERRKRKP